MGLVNLKVAAAMGGLAGWRGGRIRPRAAFIAPLDDLMWDLSLVRALFGFEYAWEVFKPAAKRTYGSYVLPVLYGDRGVARAEPTFDRDGRVLRMDGWRWEPAVDRKDAAMQAAIGECVAAFARYLGAETIRVAPKVGRAPGAVAVAR